MAKNGTYECAGQVPIIVVDGGELTDGMHGPWVWYRFPWETDNNAVAVLWYTFDELLSLGYRLADPSPLDDTESKARP